MIAGWRGIAWSLKALVGIVHGEQRYIGVDCGVH